MVEKEIFRFSEKKPKDGKGTNSKQIHKQAYYTFAVFGEVAKHFTSHIHNTEYQRGFLKSYLIAFMLLSLLFFHIYDLK